ncbi:hypothetical protein V5799_006730 [Amblyomma americanum]|uniref:Uncharacterized protein n=1 Tax=Amblyomma americanum TaxID=6943 RepID=A0AAQ4DVL5_AMBAM
MDIILLQDGVLQNRSGTEPGTFQPAPLPGRGSVFSQIAGVLGREERGETSLPVHPVQKEEEDQPVRRVDVSFLCAPEVR